MDSRESVEQRKYQEHFLKLAGYCSYRERCLSEVMAKMDMLAVDEAHRTLLVQKLTEHGYINEERFAAMFVSGKTRLKGWGKHKIRAALAQKKISTGTIDNVLKQLDEADYATTLNKALSQKLKSLKDSDCYIKKNKLARYAIGKGFEPELVWQWIKVNFKF